MKRRVTRRDIIRIAGGLSVGAALASCAAPTESVAPQPVEKEVTTVVEKIVEKVVTATPEATPELSGTISVSLYADPIVLEQKGDAATGGHGELYLLIKKWLEMHPKVKIEWAPITLEGGFARAGAIRTMLIAGTLPDIVCDYPVREMLEGNLDLLYDLKDELQKPNVYGTFERWEDEFPIGSKFFQQNVPWIPEDSRYFIGNTFTGNMGTIAFFYNKDMFDKAGITQIPTTWSEFIEDCEKLTTDDVAAYQGDNSPWGARSWMIRWFPEQLMGDTFDFICSKFGIEELTLESFAWAIKNGVIDCRDPRYLETPRLIKEFSKYWNKDWLAPEQVDYWITERVAMMQSGNWSLPTIMNNPERKFEFGTFYYPTFDKAASPFATGRPWRRAGGYSGGTSGNSMFVPLTTVKKGNWPIVRDLLQFVTCRSNNDWYCSRQYPPCIPVGKTWDQVITDPKDRTRLHGFFDPPMSKDTYLRNLGNNGMLETQMRLLDEYQLDKITLEEYGAQLQAEWERKVEKDIIEHPEWKVDQWPDPA